MARKQKTNPKNPGSSLFRRLTRLFSGPIVNRRQQQTRALKRRKLVKYDIKSVSGQEFKKNQFDALKTMQSDLMTSQGRVERYYDFNMMDIYPEINAALDLIADEMTTSSPLQPLLNIACPNEEIKEVLSQLYHNILNIEFNLFGWCRSMCKFGDFFLYLDIDEIMGVKHVIGLPVEEVDRIEGEDKTNPNYVQFQWNAAGITFENWQMAHFRILGNDKYAPFGTSAIDGARRIYRQLDLLEQAVMSYRIVRSPERRVFYIDVGSIPPNEVEQYMQQVMTTMKRNQVVDPTTGRVDLRYNPTSTEEDYYLPVRGNVSSRIETLQGGQYTGDIDDIKYFRDKLFSALKIPQAYLSQDGSSGEDKTSLSQRDIMFARTVQRLQRSVVAELEKIGIIHLYILGYRSEDLVSFKLSLNNPSKLAELQELEHWRTKFDVASAATEGHFSRRWIAKKLFNMSEEDILRNQREMFYDKWLDSEFGAIEEGEGGGEFGGGDFGGGDFGGGDFGGDDLGDAEEEEGTEEEGDETLLAAPGKRDDGGYLTPGAKGKTYYPVKTDKRDMGARKRSYFGKFSQEQGKNTTRNVFKGYSELQSLSKGIVESDEQKVISLNNDVKMLIEGMSRLSETEEKEKDTKIVIDKVEQLLNNRGKKDEE